MNDLIFVSLENWDTIWRRNQFVCAGLAQRHPDRKILFVEPPHDVTNELRVRHRFALPASEPHSPDGLPNIIITRPLKLAPNTLAAGRWLNERLARHHIQTLSRRLELQAPILWLNPHDAVHLAGRTGESQVVYDITDDWTTLTQSPAMRQRTIAQDERLCRSADRVIVCSQRLFDLKRSLVREISRLSLIPNGVDAAHYARVLDGSGPLPALAQEWPRPVFGYTGTIHPDRVDVEIITTLAQQIGKGSVVLIGPNHLPAEAMTRMRALPNVFLPGPVAYAELPDIMRTFDVCITPHVMSDFTESLNPIKLWEYLAAGKPIVSTDVAGFRDYPQFVRLARTPQEFVCEAKAAQCEDPTLQRARRLETQSHSWNARIDAIEQVLRSGRQASERE